jgi:hypothetical protein
VTVAKMTKVPTVDVVTGLESEVSMHLLKSGMKTKTNTNTMKIALESIETITNNLSMSINQE